MSTRGRRASSNGRAAPPAGMPSSSSRSVSSRWRRAGRDRDAARGRVGRGRVALLLRRPRLQLLLHGASRGDGRSIAASSGPARAPRGASRSGRGSRGPSTTSASRSSTRPTRPDRWSSPTAAAPDALVVTSRLYSTAPAPTVGMVVPGLPPSAAHPVSVLTSLRNGGFRTNVGVYNPGPSAADPAFRLYDGATLLGTVRLDAPLPPQAGAQINDVFARAGAAAISTGNGVVVVESAASAPLYSYAAVIDDATSDPIFVVGAADVSASGAVRSADRRDLGPRLGLLARRPDLAAADASRRHDLHARLPQRGHARARSARGTASRASPSSAFLRPTTSRRGTTSSFRPSRRRPGSAAAIRSSARRATAAETPSSTPG